MLDYYFVQIMEPQFFRLAVAFQHEKLLIKIEFQ